MGNGGIFGRSYGLGSLGGSGLGLVPDYETAKANSVRRGCEDATAGKPKDMSRGGAYLGFLLTDAEKKIFDGFYIQGYDSCYQSKDIAAYPKPTIPSTCGDTFWQCNSGCWNSYPNQPNRINKCVAESCIPTCPGSAPATTVPEQQIGGAGFSGQPCDSDAVKKYVQGVIGTNADGKWGPASQTALQKYGQPYKDIASGCTGNPPSYGAITGGGGGGTVTTTYAPPPAPPVASSAMSGLLSKPIVWVGLAMAAVGGYVLLTGKKGGKVKKNARKRRKVKIVKVSWGGTRKKGK